MKSSKEQGQRVSRAVMKAELSKPSSPELRPLPPLPKFNYFTSGEQVRPSKNNSKECHHDDDEENENEEFFSPRGSPGNKDSFGRIDSPRGTRRVLRIVKDELFANGSGSFNSKTAYFPSPDVSSPSASGLSSSPEIELGLSRIMPVRVSEAAEQTLPPQPPPMPPPRFWETANSPKISEGSQSSSFETVERNEETPKMKLKPLHWDKVHASSERAMVWDQIKSSSLQ